MRITKLLINHYKTIESPIEISSFSHLQILIGPNNSGKTNILDALELFFSPRIDPDRFYDPRADLSLTVELATKEPLRIACRNNERKFFIGANKISSDDPRVLKLQKSFARIQPSFSVYSLIAEELKAFKTRYPSRYTNFLGAINEHFDDIEISESLFLENVAHVYADRKDRPMTRMGEGFKRLFAMLAYVYHPDYDIILIDEPEAHLHPSVVKQFVKILETNEQANQIFLTTHSTVFAQPQNIGHLWRVARDENRNTKIHYLRHPEEEFSKERLVQELNADNTEMFFADSVLLVEGVSDRILLRGLIDRFYRGKRDIKVIYTSGKGNIDVYARLLQAFHIPYTILLDQDAITGVWSEIIGRDLAGRHKAPLAKKVSILKKKRIFILEGALEENYPRAYQTKDTKPLNALYAAYHVSGEDLASSKMRVIRELIESL